MAGRNWKIIKSFTQRMQVDNWEWTSADCHKKQTLSTLFLDSLKNSGWFSNWWFLNYALSQSNRSKEDSSQSECAVIASIWKLVWDSTIYVHSSLSTFLCHDLKLNIFVIMISDEWPVGRNCVKNYTITPVIVFGLKWQMMAGQSSVDGLGRHHQTTL